ncbi:MULTISPECIES: uroporphyrinogen-III synthase [Persephonella]|uniref:Uroporphyrinogen-III synthase n=1 Tax=Persephonella marina (strain DSM 14350 / EX-H1) TaxID=123214 RepID=C0QQD7_PERMH|nr:MULTISPECIES: uroporphyrinogen-III synthase [Persephonella]ACO04450.1 uroporphyrinogen-III synthase [Persephonella marina EX-H1]
MINILITKSEKELKKIEAVKNIRIDIIPFPAIKTIPLDFDIKTEDFDIFVFTSVNAVKYFFEKIEPERLEGKQIIAVGDKTKAELEKIGFKNIKTPQIQSSEGLLELLSNRNYKDKKIALPRAKKGIDLLIKNLDNVTLIPVYETVLNIPENVDKVKEMFEKKLVDFAVFTSPSNVENFLKIFEKGLDYLKQTKVVPIGKTTGKKLKSLGIEPFFVPEKPSIENIIKEIISSA